MQDCHGLVQGVPGDEGDYPVRLASLDLPRCALLASRLRYHLRCLREDATDPQMSSLERLALVWDCVRRIRGIRETLERRE